MKIQIEFVYLLVECQITKLPSFPKLWLQLASIIIRLSGVRFFFRHLWLKLEHDSVILLFLSSVHWVLF